MQKALQISLKTTMGEILAAYPVAKVGLFQRYHIGGCRACGYQPEDALGDVCRAQGLDEPLEGIIACIESSAAIETRLHASAREVQRAVEGGAPLRLLDTRLPSEFEAGHLPGAQLLTVELTFEALDSWPKDLPIVTYSSHGRRSLDKASYLTAYGLRSVRSLDGGLDAWRQLGGDTVVGRPMEPLPFNGE
jgi:rhodanese-related sulfurtransferase